MDHTSSCRVLSIQSHVVSGCVGNKSACFPLQLLGFNVDSVNSVQLSNHTGYPHYKGQVLNADDMHELMDGLRSNELTEYTHLLTGYIGSGSFVSEVIKVVSELKEKNPKLYFVCDPVLGDNGKMYVPEECMPLYRDKLVPLADLITPNQNEAEWLTGIKIKSEADAKRSIQALHDKGAKAVVISSCKFSDEKVLTLIGSTVTGGQQSLVKMVFPQMEATFLGTGDLFAAIILAWMTKTGGNLEVSCGKAVNTLQSVLRRTLDYAKNHCGPNKELTSKLLELQLIESREDIEHPENEIPISVIM